MDLHVKVLVPIRVQRLLDHARRVGLLAIDGDDGKRVRQTKDVPLDERVGGDDCGDAKRIPGRWRRSGTKSVQARSLARVKGNRSKKEIRVDQPLIPISVWILSSCDLIPIVHP